MTGRFRARGAEKALPLLALLLGALCIPLRAEIIPPHCPEAQKLCLQADRDGGIDYKSGTAFMLGNVVGGLSGPAIKPIALRAVYQAAQAVETPIIGIGGIATIDDVMEFLVAGATAVQLGTVNFYNPRASMEVLDALPGALAAAGATCVADIVGTLVTE